MALKTAALLIVITLGVTVLGRVSVVAGSNAQAKFDAAKTYTSKCVSCHGKKAEKKFEKTKADDAHVQVILKGKKAAKPPHMPGYESKGITADQALALVTYMKSLQP